jgi:hypothetical protein
MARTLFPDFEQGPAAKDVRIAHVQIAPQRR